MPNILCKPINTEHKLKRVLPVTHKRPTGHPLGWPFFSMLLCEFFRALHKLRTVLYILFSQVSTERVLRYWVMHQGYQGLDNWTRGGRREGGWVGG